MKEEDASPEGSGPSKNELKKLAKKAEKAAAKSGSRTNVAPKSEADKSGSSSHVAPKSEAVEPSVSASSRDTVYMVSHAAEGDAAALKVAIAASVFGVTLIAADERHQARPLPPLIGGPVLLSPRGRIEAFGGNEVTKTLSVMGNGCFTAEVDDWVEFERVELRPSLAANKATSTLLKLETALSANGGLFLVGNSTTAADIVICVTLSAFNSDIPKKTLPDIVKLYVDRHMFTPPFLSAISSLSTLIPPPKFDHTSNPSLLRAIEAVFSQSIEAAFPQASNKYHVPVSVSKCNQIKFGDYQCNASMALFQKLKAANALPSHIATPQDVAAAIVTATNDRNPVIDNLQVNGPGFILCRVKSSYLQTFVNALVSSGTVPKPLGIQSHTVVVDFSSPNIAKEMHVGHLRSTIIGESVCRILEYAGNQVKRINHVGDWGTQFGMLIQYLKEEYPDFEGDGGGSISDLTLFYKAAKARFDENPHFKKLAQSNVVKLQAGDEECLTVWKILCDVSRREFEKVYERLDITLEECGESFYNSKIPSVIKEFERAGLISVEEGGAKCVFVPKFGVPLMLQKSDGGFGYDSTDMAALKHRLSTLGASRVVYITDFSQENHFQMCFSAAAMIGWVNNDETRQHKLEHIGFGTVMGEDGKRFKTRSGDTVRLVDLLDEAVIRMEKSLQERIVEGKANITAEEVHEVASALGYGAVKYFDLRRNPTSNYKFSYDQMLDTKGNTAIYLLYAHARLESICTKGKVDFNVNVEELASNDHSAKIVIAHPSERNLVLHLQMFADMIEVTLEDLFPYHVCDFVYNVSNAVSDFVTQCKVLGSPEMESRLLLCRATAIVMRQCFDLLGIRHVMRI